MDIKKVLRDELESKGCHIREVVGIWTVTTPAGELWNFTRPERVDQNGKVIPATLKECLEPVDDTQLEEADGSDDSNILAPLDSSSLIPLDHPDDGHL